MVYLIISPDPRQGRYLTDQQGNHFWYIKFGDTGPPPPGQQYVHPIAGYQRENLDFVMIDQGPNAAMIQVPGVQGQRQIGKALEHELLMGFNIAHNHLNPAPRNEWHRIKRSNTMITTIGVPGTHQMTVAEAFQNLDRLLTLFQQMVIGPQGALDPNYGPLIEGAKVYLGPFITC